MRRAVVPVFSPAAASALRAAPRRRRCRVTQDVRPPRHRGQVPQRRAHTPTAPGTPPPVPTPTVPTSPRGMPPPTAHRRCSLTPVMHVHMHEHRTSQTYARLHVHRKVAEGKRTCKAERCSRGSRVSTGGADRRRTVTAARISSSQMPGLAIAWALSHTPRPTEPEHSPPRARCADKITRGRAAAAKPVCARPGSARSSSATSLRCCCCTGTPTSNPPAPGSCCAPPSRPSRPGDRGGS
jgi:hypothetical protein